jgi:hypothetical protein
LLDADNLIDYMLCTYYVGDPDGPVSAWARVANNFFGIYNRVHPDGFKFFRHDAEHSLYGLNEARLFDATTVAVGSSFNQSNPLWMHTHLIVHPEYRMRFADRVYKHFFNDGLLTPRATLIVSWRVRQSRWPSSLSPRAGATPNGPSPARKTTTGCRTSTA